MSWELFTEWFLSLGAEYGVDPIIFGSIYLGAIPVFWLCIAWLARNLRRGVSIAGPVMGAGLCAISAYIYLLIVGENLPLWVYGAVVALIAYGGYETAKKVRSKMDEHAPDEHTPTGESEAPPRSEATRRA